MSNDLSPYVPEFWATETLIALHNKWVLAPLVHRDFENIIAREGDTVNTRQPATFVANDFVTANGVTVQDAKATNVAVSLDVHKEVTFVIDDKDLSLGLPILMRDFVEPAAWAIADAVDTFVYSKLATGLCNTVGTPGTALSGITPLATIHQAFADQLVPGDSRSFVINPATEATFLAVPEFISALFRVGGAPSAIEEGILGRTYGMDLYMGQNVGKTVTQATASAYVTNGTQVAGSNDLIVKTGTGAIPKGGHITVGTGASPYVVTADYAGGAGTVKVYPALRAAYTDSTAVAVIGSNKTYNKLPFFHKNVFSLVNRPMGVPMAGTGTVGSVIELGGVAMRTLMSYDSKYLQHKITIDCLFGGAMLNTQLGGMLLY